MLSRMHQWLCTLRLVQARVHLHQCKQQGLFCRKASPRKSVGSLKTILKAFGHGQKINPLVLVGMES